MRHYLLSRGLYLLALLGLAALVNECAQRA